MRIIVSSSNKDKIKEIKAKLSDKYELITKAEAGYEELEVEENGETLEENARLKARALYELTKEATFADDSGLFVQALDGRPGVFAARYAGPGCSYQDNVDKMLRELSDFPNLQDRKAYFETVICYIDAHGREHYVKGQLQGYIALEARGEEGFGYDPIFIPEGLDKSMAELGIEVKNKISHRARALDNFNSLLGDL